MWFPLEKTSRGPSVHDMVTRDQKRGPRLTIRSYLRSPYVELLALLARFVILHVQSMLNDSSH